jgi:hypothetical protein
MSKLVPKQKDTIDAERGRNLHADIIKPLKATLDKAIYLSAVDSNIEFVINAVKDLVSKKYEYTMEERVTLNRDIYGHCDLSIYDRSTLHIIDYKFGAQPVYAQDNMQLGMYALMKLLQLKREGRDFKTVKLVIIQPAFSKVDINVLNKDKSSPFTGFNFLDEVYAKVIASYKEILTTPGRFNPSNETCHMCPARAHCDAFAAFALKHHKKDFLSYEEKLEIIKNKAATSTLIRGIEEYIIDRALKNEAPGIRLEPGLSKRKWGNVDEVKKILGDAVTSQSILSVSDVEKKIGKEEFKRLKLSKHVVREPTSSKIVFIEDDYS